jgi:hypothetical protein
MSKVGTIEMSGNYIRWQIQIACKPVWFLTHAYPHADEILSAMMMEDYGTDAFVQKYAHNGVIRCGVMYDAFDEHHAPGKEETIDDCAATLVAKALGVYDNWPLVKSLDYVHRIDTQGKDPPQALGTLIKHVHKANPSWTARVIEWTKTAFYAKINAAKQTGDFERAAIIALLQEQFPAESRVAEEWERTLDEAMESQRQAFNAALEEIRSKASIREIPGPSGRRLKLIVIESDNNEASKAGRAEEFQADIVIQQRTSGNVHIFTNTRAKLRIFQLARMLRLEEQRKRNKIVETDWRRLADEGICPLGIWYFHHKGQFILNGSLTAQNVEPTALLLNEIVELTEISVDPTRFEPSRAILCQAGDCTGTRDNPCPWYGYGLNQCKNARKGKKEEEYGKE